MMSMQARGVVSREERLPRSFDTVTAEWLTRFPAPAYPGLQVLAMDVVEFIEGHTSKVRIKVSLNQAGRDAGIPEALCQLDRQRAQQRGLHRRGAVLQ